MELHTIYQILAVMLLIIGSVIALFGRAVWKGLFASFGGMIGWMIGFGIGVWIFGFDTWTGIIISVIIAFISSFIMGALFGMIVEIALAVLVGILAGGLVFLLTGNLLVAVIVFGIVGILAYVLMDKVVILVTALIGSVLAAAAVYYLMDWEYAIVAFIAIFALGLLIQFVFLADNDNIFE